MTFQEHFNIGLSLAKDRKYNESVYYFNKVIELDPYNSQAHSCKGLALNYLGKYLEALEYLNKATELDDKNAAAHNNKGLVLYNLGKYQESISCCETAISIYASFPEAYLNKGLSLNQLGKYQDAIACYNKAVQINPKYANAYNSMGVALSNLKMYQEAIYKFDIAISLDAKDFAIYHNKATALYALGKEQEAIWYFDQAIKLSPNFALAYCGRAIVKVALGRQEEAIKDIVIISSFINKFIGLPSADLQHIKGISREIISQTKTGSGKDCKDSQQESVLAKNLNFLQVHSLQRLFETLSEEVDKIQKSMPTLSERTLAAEANKITIKKLCANNNELKEYRDGVRETFSLKLSEAQCISGGKINFTGDRNVIIDVVSKVISCAGFFGKLLSKPIDSAHHEYYDEELKRKSDILCEFAINPDEFDKRAEETLASILSNPEWKQMILDYKGDFRDLGRQHARYIISLYIDEYSKRKKIL